MKDPACAKKKNYFLHPQAKKNLTMNYTASVLDLAAIMVQVFKYE